MRNYNTLTAMNLRTIQTMRYVTPLREGGSLPAIVEGDDDGLYVLKFRGAGQGTKALIAELVAGEIARTLGFKIPEIVFVELNTDLARTEPDPEIQDLIKGSGGLNLALDYLPGSIMYDPLIEKPSGELASRIVWFDAFTANVDRTPRNANMLWWHNAVWLIDHGAALFYQHDWDRFAENSANPFKQIKDHMLLPFADQLEKVDGDMKEKIIPEVLKEIVGLIPDEWMERGKEDRSRYIEFLTNRLETSRNFVEEALDARNLHI